MLLRHSGVLEEDCCIAEAAATRSNADVDQHCMDVPSTQSSRCDCANWRNLRVQVVVTVVNCEVVAMAVAHQQPCMSHWQGACCITET